MGLKKIGIITGGGDCGGLNAVIRGAALMALSKGIQAYIIPNGYAGLYNLVTMDRLTELTPSRVDAIDIEQAGSEAGHSRVELKKVAKLDPKVYERIQEGLRKFSLDALVVSGGDDTSGVMVNLGHHGVKAVHAPKTMDLDLVPYSVGGDSTINRIREFVRDLSTTGRSHNRIMVVEVFGRYAGHTAFRGGVAAGADAVLIPEIPVDFDVLFDHIRAVYFRRVRESDVRAGTYSIVVAEGLKDASGRDLIDESVPPDPMGHRKLAGAGKYVCQEIDKRMEKNPEVIEFMKETGMFTPGVYEEPEVRAVVPQHLVRCGFTSAYDVKFGLEAGAGAVLLLIQGIAGVTVTEVVSGQVKYMKTEDARKQRHVDPRGVALYEQLGFCFGRKPQPFAPTFEEVTGMIPRIYQ